MRRGGGSRAIRVLAAAAAAVLLALAIAQLVLPRIAASRISSKIGRYGEVADVSVSAWPAVELLWGHADSVTVRARRLALSPARAAALLWEARGTGSLDVHAEAVRLGSLALSGATLRKRGASLAATATTTDAQARAALPAGVSVRLLGSSGGSVEVLAAGSLFGVGVGVRTIARPSDGELVAAPASPLLEAFKLTLFADPHVYVLGVGARVVSRSPLTYSLALSGRLR